MLNPSVCRFDGESKGKILSEPLLTLGVRRVDGGVLGFRRASGRAQGKSQKREENMY